MNLYERIWVLSLVGLSGLAGTPPARAQNYQLTDLGTLGGSASMAFALNDLGQVVGIATRPPNDFPTHAFLWQDGEMMDLGTLGGGFDSFAYGINNFTQVVGTSQVGAGGQDAFLWEDGGMVPLSAPDGTPALAEDINDAGQVTGIANTSFAYIWENGDLIDLGTLPGFTESHGFGINEAGEVVGSAFSCAFCGAHAFHWADGVMTDLSTLPGYDASVAWEINDASQVVGYSVPIIPSTPRATLWDDGEIIDLGIGGGTRSLAYSINNAGVIVGYWGTSDHPAFHYATKWVDGQLIDLNDLVPPDSGWQLSEALDINESGQITGLGLNPDSMWRGFLLTPCASADFNCDGGVGPFDLALLLGGWGPCPMALS